MQSVCGEPDESEDIAQIRHPRTVFCTSSNQANAGAAGRAAWASSSSLNSFSRFSLSTWDSGGASCIEPEGSISDAVAPRDTYHALLTTATTPGRGVSNQLEVFGQHGTRTRTDCWSQLFVRKRLREFVRAIAHSSRLKAPCQSHRLLITTNDSQPYRVVLEPSNHAAVTPVLIESVGPEMKDNLIATDHQRLSRPQLALTTQRVTQRR